MYKFPIKKIERKILTKKTLKKYIERKRNKTIIFTNWCFDLMHYWHLHYLAEAAKSGDVLIVGINSDKSIKKIKGIGRPINDELSRLFQIASLAFVDAVIIFKESTPINLIKIIKPNILIKWGDYLKKEVVGHEIVEEYGWEIKVTKLLLNYSTTSLEKKILWIK